MFSRNIRNVCPLRHLPKLTKLRTLPTLREGGNQELVGVSRERQHAALRCCSTCIGEIQAEFQPAVHRLWTGWPASSVAVHRDSAAGRHGDRCRRYVGVRPASLAATAVRRRGPSARPARRAHVHRRRPDELRLSQFVDDDHHVDVAARYHDDAAWREARAPASRRGVDSGMNTTRYDDTEYLACAKKRNGGRLNLPHGTTEEQVHH